jgi:hypothetical protein
MHFSGFSLPSNGRISKHTNRRFDLDTEAVLKEMIYDYEASLIASRARFKHLSGDLGFSNLPLQQRIRIASDIWKVPHLAESKPKFLSRIRYFLRSRFVNKN